ncbi:peroxiredoxin family protein [Mucilaginibacter sp. X4EP1]|uniref:peroxiredoxin family protein n=1 Tax=Mucilaginibacter sp. X4EP1 TaxID=2723092 RepID=UPI0021686710|nr:redoxin domain-containing protein [Mucilaginibacter sp. X4EP1]MCS3812870.1 thiol-disulfide isomerase/thioredoxin [Mucilaginibacter sp. X4EP1]
MKRNIFLIGIMLLVMLSFVLILKSCLSNDKSEQVTINQRKRLPAFTFYNLDSTRFSNINLGIGVNTCIIYFDPDCDFCESEISSIIANITAFKNTQLLLISFNSPEKIRAAEQKFKLNQFKNIRLLWDKDVQFDSLFGKSIIPSTFIYNKDQLLLKEYHGLVSIKAITQWLN